MGRLSIGWRRSATRNTVSDDANAWAAVTYHVFVKKREQRVRGKMGAGTGLPVRMA